jgi:hypothetical protein
MESLLYIGLVVERKRVKFEVICLDEVLEVNLTKAKALWAVSFGCLISFFTNFE